MQTHASANVFTWTVALIAVLLSPTHTHANNQSEPAAAKPLRVLVKSDVPMGRSLFGQWYLVELTAMTQEQAVQQAQGLSGVISAEPDAEIQLHYRPKVADWYVSNQGQFGGRNTQDIDTDAPAAWDFIERNRWAGAKRVRVAVVDSGIYQKHGALRGVKFFADKDFTSTSEAGDLFGHGTAVASVIVAMLPDRRWVSLGSYRVFNQHGSASYSQVLEGFKAAVEDGARVVNFSGGGGRGSEALRDYMVSRPDVVFVCSAGNSGPWSGKPEYPAQYHDLPNVISVSAIEQSGALTYFTNVGALIAAPGEYVFTAMVPCDVDDVYLCQPAGYGFLAGTSFSAPIVSAILGGRLVLHPYETPAELRRKLLGTVDRDERYSEIKSHGRANFHKFVIHR